MCVCVHELSFSLLAFARLFCSTAASLRWLVAAPTVFQYGFRTSVRLHFFCLLLKFILEIGNTTLYVLNLDF